MKLWKVYNFEDAVRTAPWWQSLPNQMCRRFRDVPLGASKPGVPHTSVGSSGVTFTLVVLFLPKPKWRRTHQRWGELAKCIYGSGLAYGPLAPNTDKRSARKTRPRQTIDVRVREM
jgi:hypothetical protein